MSIIYRPDHKAIRKAFHANLIEEETYWNDTIPTKKWLAGKKIPFKIKIWYTEEEVDSILGTHTRWLISHDSTDYFKPFCIWCRYMRYPLANDEHEECDAYLDVVEEVARAEGVSDYETFVKTLPVTTLGAYQPGLPSVVLDKIASFL